MDLLFAFQNMRESVSPVLTEFFMLVSNAVIYVIPVAIMAIYWCGDKEYGKQLITELTYGFWFNGIAKLTACIYRPWVLDHRLYVFQDAADTATGYSFPSAHTTVAAIGLTNLATHTRKKAWRAVSIFLIILVMFSRMWLGCHSFADVAAGLLIGIGSMFAVRFIDKKLANNDRRNLIKLAIAIALSAVSVIYIETKQYPVDLDSAGRIIVDANDMKPDTYMGIAMILGWTVGNMIEERFIGFTVDGSTGAKVIRTAAGAVLFLSVYLGLKALPASWDVRLVKFLRMFVSFISATVLYPWIFMKWRNRK